MFNRLILLFFIVLSSPLFASDFDGAKVKKVYASNPTLLYQLYALDRDLIAGLIFEFWDDEKQYLDEKTVNLPVIGGWLGQGRSANAEMVLSVHPDVILLSEWMKTYAKQRVEQSLGSIKIPHFYIKDESLLDLAQSFGVLADVFGSKKRGYALRDWGLDSIDIAKEIASKNPSKPTVYYAGSRNGLKTECHTSFRMELIGLAGGDNVHKCETKGHYDSQIISFEQILTYNPEIILVKDTKFYKKIFTDSSWKLLDAVKNKKVYLIPSGPFNWVDNPPSFMRFLGLKWLVSIFHPYISSIDIEDEMRDFYKLFLKIDLTPMQIDEILHR